jgi:hypothetical protein
MWQFLVPIIATMHNSKNELYIASGLEASQYAMGKTPSWPTNNGNGQTEVSPFRNHLWLQTR